MTTALNILGGLGFLAVALVVISGPSVAVIYGANRIERKHGPVAFLWTAGAGLTGVIPASLAVLAWACEETPLTSWFGMGA